MTGDSYFGGVPPDEDAREEEAGCPICEATAKEDCAPECDCAVCLRQRARRAWRQMFQSFKQKGRAQEYLAVTRSIPMFADLVLDAECELAREARDVRP